MLLGFVWLIAIQNHFDPSKSLYGHQHLPKSIAVHRKEIYDKYYDLLEEQGFAYPCFCTTEELERSRKAELRRGRPPRYSGKCRNLSKDEIEKEKIEITKQSPVYFEVTNNTENEVLSVLQTILSITPVLSA